MPINTPLPTIIKDLLTSKKAMTITKRVVVSKHVVDSVFMASTPQAAHLYGYREPNDLIGKWLSQTHSHHIARRSFVLAYFRHTGQKIGTSASPSAYVTFLTLPDGATRAVIKQTQEIIWEGEIYWVTEIEEAKGETSIPSILDFEMPKPQDDFRAWSGIWTISDIESHIACSLEDSGTQNQLTDSTMTGNIDYVNSKMIFPDSTMQPYHYTKEIPLQESTTGRVQRPHYLHRCAECSGTWIGTTQNPAQCIYCTSRLWRGFSKWEERKRSGKKR